jgi:hypothetical protein
VLEGGSAGALTPLAGPGMVVWWVPGGPGRGLFHLFPQAGLRPMPSSADPHLHGQIEAAKYWRDLMMQCLSWGMASGFLVCGYAVSDGENYSFHDKLGPSLFLIISIACIGITWTRATLKLHRLAVNAREAIANRDLRTPLLSKRTVRWACLMTTIYTFLVGVATCVQATQSKDAPNSGPGANSGR